MVFSDQQKLLTMVSQLKINQNSGQRDETDENEFEALPIKTAEELNQLNQKLKDDASFKTRFVSDLYDNFLLLTHY